MKTLREWLNVDELAWSITKQDYAQPNSTVDMGELFFWACKWQSHAKQMDALLEECYWALQCPIKSQVMIELLKNNGYGNDAD